MNLKESFRYASFLENITSSANASLRDSSRALITTKTHQRSLADPAIGDFTETVDEGDFYKNDDVIRFVQFVIDDSYALRNRKSRHACSHR